jgi:hypothetical protein
MPCPPPQPHEAPPALVGWRGEPYTAEDAELDRQNRQFARLLILSGKWEADAYPSLLCCPDDAEALRE